jgi:hypothetical protein
MDAQMLRHWPRHRHLRARNRLGRRDDPRQLRQRRRINDDLRARDTRQQKAAYQKK